MWRPFEEGRTIGQAGSEAGLILIDEAHPLGARITLERDGHTPFAITCGIYGWMVHTCFFGQEAVARRAFAAMRRELDAIIRSIPPDADPERNAKMKRVEREIADFVERHR